MGLKSQIWLTADAQTKRLHTKRGVFVLRAAWTWLSGRSPPGYRPPPCLPEKERSLRESPKITRLLRENRPWNTTTSPVSFSTDVRHPDVISLLERKGWKETASKGHRTLLLVNKELQYYAFVGKMTFRRMFFFPFRQTKCRLLVIHEVQVELLPCSTWSSLSPSASWCEGKAWSCWTRRCFPRRRSSRPGRPSAEAQTISLTSQTKTYE